LRLSSPHLLQTSVIDTNGQTRLNRQERLRLAAIGLGLALPLLVAMILTPDTRGHGTHQQLGLPPCTFVALFGWRCPTCGMTTSWAHLVRGELVESLRANAGGTLLGVLDLLAMAGLLLSAARGRWTPRPLGSTAGAWLAVSVTAVVLIDWAIRLAAAW